MDNSLLRSLFGETVLTIGISGIMMLYGLLLSLVIGVLSSIFPVSLAMRYEPAKAIAND